MPPGSVCSPPEEFECSNLVCHPSTVRCDGVWDCSDGIDEAYCDEDGGK